MGSKQLLLGSSLVVTAVLMSATSGFSQAQPAQSRVPQQVVINGQRVSAVNVVAPGGGFQAYTCLNPQQYSTVDGSSQGWACYEQSTGVWILNALPPAQVQQPQPQVQAQPRVQLPPPQPQVQVPQPPAPLPQPQVRQPAVIYPQQSPTVIYQQPQVVYQPPPTVIYTAPVYPAPPVIYAPAYPASVVLGTAAIEAAGRIVSSAIIGSRFPRAYYAPFRSYPVRVWRRY
jgi:hypothetical protein